MIRNKLAFVRPSFDQVGDAEGCIKPSPSSPGGCLRDQLSLEAYGVEGVILLHGLCRSSDSMNKMEGTLVREGRVVLNVDYPSRTAGVEALSSKVIGEALRWFRRAGVAAMGSLNIPCPCKSDLLLPSVS